MCIWTTRQYADTDDNDKVGQRLESGFREVCSDRAHQSRGVGVGRGGLISQVSSIVIAVYSKRVSMAGGIRLWATGGRQWVDTEAEAPDLHLYLYIIYIYIYIRKTCTSTCGRYHYYDGRHSRSRHSSTTVAAIGLIETH